MARYEVSTKYSFIVDLNEFNSCFVFKNDLYNFNEKNIIGLREHAIIDNNNKDSVEYKNDIYYDVSPYLNKYDVYDSILTYLIDLNKDINSIKDYVNEDYFTFDMYIKLYSNSINYPLPSKYSKKDFSKLLGMKHDQKYDEVVNSLYEKYKDIVMEEQKNYFIEEERNLKANRDRICNLMEEKVNELANLANCRNTVDEKVRNLK